MIIYCDDREPKVMLDLLRVGGEESNGIEVKRNRLKVGDYVCGKTVVERKEINDFCGSLVDGRLKRQVVAMKKEFDNVFVLVSGHIKDRHGNIHENCLLGKIVSLLIKDGVSVLLLDDDIQLVYCMKRIFERLEGVGK